MTDKQIAFCENYIIDFNATQAAIRAGYSEKTANRIASQLLSKLDIQTKISKLKLKATKKAEITLDKVLREYANIAFSDMKNVLEEDGTFKKINELDRNITSCISSIEVNELKYNGANAGDTKKMRFYDKLRALDSLMQYLEKNGEHDKELSKVVIK